MNDSYIITFMCQPIVTICFVTKVMSIHNMYQWQLRMETCRTHLTGYYTYTYICTHIDSSDKVIFKKSGTRWTWLVYKSRKGDLTKACTSIICGICKLSQPEGYNRLNMQIFCFSLSHQGPARKALYSRDNQYMLYSIF